MNRRGFFRGLLSSAVIIPSVSTKAIVDLAANTWRSAPAPIGFYGAAPVAGEFYRVREGDPARILPGNALILGAMIAEMRNLGLIKRSRKLEEV